MSSDQTVDDASTTSPRRESRLLAFQRNGWVRGLVIGAAVIFVLYGTVASRLDAIVAQQQTREFAEPLDELCATSAEARETVGTARCEEAAAVKDAPIPIVEAGRNGTNGRNGQDGDPGRGIVSTDVVNGHLMVTYTDGQVEDKGVVVGANGVAGTVGLDGRGVVGTAIDEDGRLRVSYSDNTSEILGTVVGRDGSNGRGVLRTEVRDGRLLVYYTDAPDDPIDAGPLPVGPEGIPGRGITTVDLNLAACTLTIYYTDDTNEVKTVTGCEPEVVEPPTTEEPSPPPNDEIIGSG